VWALAFSPAEQSLAPCAADGTVRVWALATRQCVRTLEGHQGAVLRVVFLAHGLHLATVAADGLLKLWSVKRSECLGTWEAHSDKAWALAVTPSEQRLATGGADGALRVWRDNTRAQEAQRQALDAQRTLQEQRLANLLHQGRHADALALAIDLDQPQRALTALYALVAAQPPDMLPASARGADASKVQAALTALPRTALLRLLQWLVQWNTNAKHAPTTQVVLAHLLALYSPASLARLAPMKTALQGLVPYSQRHERAMHALVQQSYALDYALAQMLDAPTAAGDDATATSTLSTKLTSELTPPPAVASRAAKTKTPPEDAAESAPPTAATTQATATQPKSKRRRQSAH